MDSEPPVTVYPSKYVAFRFGLYPAIVSIRCIDKMSFRTVVTVVCVARSSRVMGHTVALRARRAKNRHAQQSRDTSVGTSLELAALPLAGVCSFVDIDVDSAARDVGQFEQSRLQCPAQAQVRAWHGHGPRRLAATRRCLVEGSRVYLRQDAWPDLARLRSHVVISGLPAVSCFTSRDLCSCCSRGLRLGLCLCDEELQVPLCVHGEKESHHNR